MLKNGGGWSGELNGRIVNGSITSKLIDLTAVSSAEMTFDWRIKRNLDRGEFVALDLSQDGQNWEEGVAILRGNQDQENTWIEESIDLNDWVGGEVQARFRGSMSASKERVNVDDILITGSLIQESDSLFSNTMGLIG
ncbi:metallopeptidase [Synechococcus sp. SYN20]|nr:metallopeptidase [Synechococcus sp. SYN20]